MTLWKAMYLSSANPFGITYIFLPGRLPARRLRYLNGALWYKENRGRGITHNRWVQYFPAEPEFYRDDWQIFEYSRPSLIRIKLSTVIPRNERPR